MEIIFLFYVNGWIDTVCEDFNSAILTEQYLSTRYNDIVLVTIIAPSLDYAWEASNNHPIILKR